MTFSDLFTDTAVIDIETVASPQVENLLDPVKAPSNWKDVFKIQVYQQEKLAERIATASLEPDLCEIVALGFMRGDERQITTRADADELILLDHFWERVNECRLLGFNIFGFDLPVLIRRSQLLGLDYPNLNIDRYRTPHIDLAERLSFNGKLQYRSLNFYCRRFGIPNDDTTAGSDIAGLVAAGEWDVVKNHCESDIRKTALLAQRLGLLKLPVEAA